MSEQLHIQQIAELIKGKPLLSDPKTSIKTILLDSRKYRGEQSCLFFALKGSNHDGHNFIKDLYDRGLRNFVVEEPTSAQYDDANFIVTDNTLAALHSLALFKRVSSKATIIGITGSNGKTIVKEWLSGILQDSFRLTKNFGSYNSRIGVPLSLWELKKDDELGIFEAGISEPDEMLVLEKLLKPKIGIITNIGSAHDQYFKDRKQKALEKLNLFKDSELVIYNEDDSVLHEILSKKNDAKWRSWSRRNNKALFYISKLESGENHTIINGQYKNEEKTLNIPFSDSASIENAIHCWLCCLEMNIPESYFKPKFAKLQAVAMRLELKGGRKNSIIINDTYNSDLESLKVALDFLKQQAQNRPLVVVLSDILQTGIKPEDLYKEVKQILQTFNIDEFIGIGTSINAQQNLFNNFKASFYLNTSDFLKESYRYNWENKAVLLKGSRPFEFEKISRKIESKSHETVLEIHLSRIVHNLNYYRSLLKPDVKTMAMVKAFSYGSGSYEIAGLLQFHKVDYLAVAYTDEGVDLRKAGVHLPILVLNAEPTSFEDLIEYKLEPEIYSFRMLEGFTEIWNQYSGREVFPVHIKLDTGMHRLGFETKDIPRLIEVLKKESKIKVASVFSHLAAADDDSQKEFTRLQIDSFRKMTDELELSIGKFDRHILNSSGIDNFPGAQFDMVRLGIGLYGISSNREQRKFLQTVSDFKAVISQVKYLKKGDTVGYGLGFTAPSEMKIATITAGYADGLRRNLSDGIGKVFIRDRFHPIIGKVCMDMCMIDITGSDAEEGDLVEIFGDHISIYDLANWMDTIPYEVLTGISQRVKRIYFME